MNTSKNDSGLSFRFGPLESRATVNIGFKKALSVSKVRHFKNKLL